MSRIPASFPLCMDGRMLVPGATGVARYARSLADTMRVTGGRPMILTDGDDGPIGRWAAALRPGARAARIGHDAAGAEELRGDRLFRAAQVRFSLSRRRLAVRPDIGPGLMHWTYPVPMRMKGWINIYTVHDVIPLDRPDLSPVDAKRLRSILDRIAGSGDRIVTVSDHARGRILAQLDVAPERVVNCYQAVDAVAADTAAALPSGLRRGEYLLYCGLDEPRKNLSRLVDAYRASGVSMPLVLVGPGGGKDMVDGAILRLSYVDDRTLAALQAGALALLFPSLAEGFGLPVVEAMAAGTPVLTSRIGALAEVARDAAMLVDPEDVAEIAAGIRRLTAEPMLRLHLAEAGRRRAARFSRARFAARLRAVYAQAIAQDGLA